MGTVVSLTEAKIQELVAGWEGVSLTQEQINALVSQLVVSQAVLDATMEEFVTVVKPQLEADLAAGAIAVSELNDVVLPELINDLASNSLSLENLNTVTLPALQEELQNEIDVNAERPKIYVQPEPPDNPDENDRVLQPADRWYDDDNDLADHIWNGTEWVLYEFEIPDLSEAIEAYISPEHALYKSPVTDSIPVTIGANITPT